MRTKALQVACIIVAIIIAYSFSLREPLPVPQDTAAVDNLEKDQAKLDKGDFASRDKGDLASREYVPAPAPPQNAAVDHPEKQQARLENEESSLKENSSFKENDESSLKESAPEPASSKPDFSYLAYYAYSEVPPDVKPADTVLNSLKDVPVGTPLEEIQRACDAFGLDPIFMKAVAKIESGFDPKQRTGSYIGLFQLSNYEFARYGSGTITDARDNAIAAAYKFTTEAILFELDTHKKPTLYDRYLIHQQGSQGAAEHVSHPDWVAWKSMCATDEGREKGEKWCKRAIWQNTLPAIKQVWKSVDNLTSGAFVTMWQQRVDEFYSRYSQALTAK